VSGLGTDILRYKKDILYLSKQHLFLVAISGSLAIVFGIAVGIWLSRPWMARWSDGVIQAVNMITSIPTLGKLALMMSLLGIGPLPAIVGLWIATLLPIIRNTYEGIRAVPAHMVDAARGMGMSNNEILKRVELPNALFVIFAGVRTAMAVNVGTVPIAFLIGGGGLGGLEQGQAKSFLFRRKQQSISNHIETSQLPLIDIKEIVEPENALLDLKIRG